MLQWDPNSPISKLKQIICTSYGIMQNDNVKAAITKKYKQSEYIRKLIIQAEQAECTHWTLSVQQKKVNIKFSEIWFKWLYPWTF